MSLGSEASAFFGAAGAAGGGYVISRSLRFNEADSAYLSRTPTATGNRKTWTWAGWVKRSALGAAYKMIFSAGTVSNECSLRFTNSPSDALEFYQYSGGGFNWRLVTAQVFRDTSAWYHIVAVVDSTQGTASDRIKLYVNGVQVTAFGTATYPSSNYDSFVNSTTEHGIGRVSASQYFDGYLADVHFIDGQALDPTSFGEFDANGIWQPKAYTGSYGTNGFHLDFADNSTAAALGTDTSPNGNTWTVNNISVSTSYFSVSPAPTAPQDAFNGVTSDYAYAGSTTIFTLNPAVAVTGGRIDMIGRVGPGYTYKAITNAGTFTLSEIGAWPGLSGSYGQQYSVTNGSITSLLGVQVETTSGNWTLAGVQTIGNPSVVGNQLLVISFAVPPTDSLRDSPANGDTANDTGVGGEVLGNYCTWNPLQQKGTITLSNGNLDVNSASTAHGHCGATFAVSSGKWYWELTKSSSTATGADGFGFAKTKLVPNPSQDYLGLDAGKNYIFTQSNLIYMVDNGTTTTVSSASAANDAGVYMFAYDFDNGKGWAGKDGVWWTWNALTGGDPANGTNPVFDDFTAGDFYTPVMQHYTASNPYSANFGQRPFAYTAPSGFKALCTANLDTPTIEDGSTAMDVALYTGNGSTNTISGLNLSPDLVWIKTRSAAVSHALQDIVRGTNKVLYSNSTDTEDTYTDALTSFNSDGFTLGAQSLVNNNTSTYVAWTWDAGSSTVPNNDGSITSSVRANPSAGFSIVTYTGNGNNATVGHGLGVVPALVITKDRSVTNNWLVVVNITGYSGSGYLNTTGAFTSRTLTYTSSTFRTLNAPEDSTNNSNYVAYCFAPVEGYSAFGSYTGNGSADGPFVYTGFKVRWLMVKRSSSSGYSWQIHDTERLPYNVNTQALFANGPDSEYTFSSAVFDLLSNGFKPRGGDSYTNASGETYIYAAFAENPFALNARAR